MLAIIVGGHLALNPIKLIKQAIPWLQVGFLLLLIPLETFLNTLLYTDRPTWLGLRRHFNMRTLMEILSSSLVCWTIGFRAWFGLMNLFYPYCLSLISKQRFHFLNHFLSIDSWPVCLSILSCHQAMNHSQQQCLRKACTSQHTIKVWLSARTCSERKLSSRMMNSGWLRHNITNFLTRTCSERKLS